MIVETQLCHILKFPFRGLPLRYRCTRLSQRNIHRKLQVKGKARQHRSRAQVHRPRPKKRFRFVAAEPMSPASITNKLANTTN